MNRGFTLLEVLVAVVIVAILALAVGIGLSGLGGSRQVKQEAERLQHHLEYACEMAQLNGRALGLRLQTHGYVFVQRQADRWQLPKQQAALSAYTLGHGVDMVMRRDGQVLQPLAHNSETPDNAQDPATRQPDLICFASGELTPFEADFSRQDANQRFQVTGKADGSITLSQSDVPH